MQHRRTFAALTLTAGLILTGCASNDESPTGDGFNDADVAFAQQMIPHHQQALEMARLAGTRASSSGVKELAAAIADAQDPEIETMTGWLETWDEKVPTDSATAMGHDLDDMEDMDNMDNMDGDGDGDDASSEGMTGMMSDQEMADLEDASGRNFDEMFLRMMIEHHEGAVEMAQTEQAEGEYAPALELAEDIETAQTTEITTMRELLAP
jgi:uncharacterized protein (DUF305 family)